MTDPDEDFAEKLIASYRGVPAEPSDDTTSTSEEDVDTRFAEQLMRHGDSKRRERQQRRAKDDRRQEGEDRWRTR